MPFRHFTSPNFILTTAQTQAVQAVLRHIARDYSAMDFQTLILCGREQDALYLARVTGNLDAFFCVVRALYSRGKVDEALWDEMMALADQHPEEDKEILGMARLMVKDGRYDDALRYFNQHQVDLWDTIEVKTEIAKILLQAGRNAEAETALDVLEHTARNVTDMPFRCSKMADAACALFETGHISRAQALLDDLQHQIETYSEWTICGKSYAFEAFAESLYICQQSERALIIFQKVEQLLLKMPSVEDYLFVATSLTRCYRKVGENDLAVVLLRAVQKTFFALDEDERKFYFYRDIWELLKEVGFLEEAKTFSQTYSEALSDELETADVNAVIKNGTLDEAERLIHSLKFESHQRVRWSQLALRCAESGDYANADRVLKLKREHLYSKRLIRGDWAVVFVPMIKALLENQRYEAAYVAAEKILTWSKSFRPEDDHMIVSMKRLFVVEFIKHGRVENGVRFIPEKFHHEAMKRDFMHVIIEALSEAGATEHAAAFSQQLALESRPVPPKPEGWKAPEPTPLQTDIKQALQLIDKNTIDSLTALLDPIEAEIAKNPIPLSIPYLSPLIVRLIEIERFEIAIRWIEYYEDAWIHWEFARLLAPLLTNMRRKGQLDAAQSLLMRAWQQIYHYPLDKDAQRSSWYPKYEETILSAVIQAEFIPEAYTILKMYRSAHSKQHVIKELGLKLAEKHRFTEAGVLFQQLDLDHYVSAIAASAVWFDEIEPGLGIQVLEEAMRIAGSIDARWQELYQVIHTA